MNNFYIKKDQILIIRKINLELKSIIKEIEKNYKKNNNDFFQIFIYFI